MTSHESRRHTLDQLAEEFIDRLRRGERPSAEEYAARNPDLASEIRDLFQTLAQREDLESGRGRTPNSSTVTVLAPGDMKAEELRQIGDYRILREIGRGGMGVVYEAVQESLGRHVALKVLPFYGRLDKKLRVRFLREARAAARLHHTNIVPVFGVGHHEETYFYAMQFIHGQPLDLVLREVKWLRAKPTPPSDSEPATRPEPASIALHLLSGQFPPAAGPKDAVDRSVTTVRGGNPPHLAQPTPPAASEPSGRAGSLSELTGQPDRQYFRSVARLGAQVADALAYAHQNRIVHRDIKPSNLLVDFEGAIWITDFGLAKTEESGDLTEAGDIVGTLRYIAPEQLRGAAEPRSDIYSLGVTLYEMLTLQPGFQDSQRARMVEKILHEEPPRPKSLDKRIPRDLETVVLKCIAKEPNARYRSAQHVAEDLRRFLAGRPILARRTGALERLWRWSRRNPASAAAMALAVVAILALVALGINFSFGRQQSLHMARLQQEQERTQKALQQAERYRRRAEQLSATLTLTQGQTLCEQDDAARGMLWLARSLEMLPPESPDLERTIRANLSAWRLRVHALRRVLPHEREVISVAISPDGKTLLTGTQRSEAHLWDMATGKRLRSLPHAGIIRAVAFSPDGARVVTAGAEGSAFDARLWDAETGELLASLAHQDQVRAVTFDPTGRSVATASYDGTAKIWDAATGELQAALPHDSAVRDVAFRADGDVVATASEDQSVRLWEVPMGNPLQTLEHDDEVWRLAFSPDGKVIASGGKSGKIWLWNLATETSRTLPTQRGGIIDLAFGPTGALLASGTSDGDLGVWEVETGGAIEALSRQQGIVSCLTFNREGTLLAAVDDTSVRLWDIAAQKVLGSPLQHAGRVRAVAFTPNGKELVTGDETFTARIWRVGAGESEGNNLAAAARDPNAPTTFWDGGTTSTFGRSGQTDRVGALFSPDGRAAATHGRDGVVQLWDATTGEAVAVLTSTGEHGTLAFSPNSRLVAVGCADGSVGVWDASTGAPQAAIPQHTGESQNGRRWIWSLAFSPDNRLLATGSGDEFARLWDVSTGKLLQTLRHEQGPILAVAFTPNGTVLWSIDSVDEESKIHRWEVATGRPWGPPLPNAESGAIAFNSDGSRAVTGSWTGHIRIWNARSGEILGKFDHPHRGIAAAVFSPDTLTLATGSRDGNIRLFAVQSGKWLGVLRHGGSVTSVAFSPKGDLILTGGRDRAARLWDASTLLPVGPALSHPESVFRVGFSADGGHAVTGTGDGRLRVWRCLPPVKGSAEQVSVWVETLTGLSLDRDGVLHVLDAGSWEQRRRRLRDLEDGALR